MTNGQARCSARSRSTIPGCNGERTTRRASMQFDPNTRVDTDIRGAYRDAYEGTGGPSTWLLPKDKADQLVQQQQQQQEAMEAANQVGHVAEQGGKAAAAVTNVGQAATSLQDAGLAG